MEKQIERQIDEKKDELINILWDNLRTCSTSIWEEIERTNDELSALKSQLKDAGQVRSSDEILKDNLSIKFWGIINKESPGDEKNDPTFKRWILEAMYEFASQFQEQPITVTDEMIEIAFKAGRELDGKEHWNPQGQLLPILKWKDYSEWYKTLSLKAQKAQPGDEMSPRVARLILQIRDVYVQADTIDDRKVEDVYHFLYQIASPDYDKMSEDVWTEIERIARTD